MNKQEFLVELKSELYERELAAKAIDEIVEDYDSLISEAVLNGELAEDIIKRLGTPSQIARKLARMEMKEKARYEKLIAVSPFVATIIFIILGMQFDLWHPGWIVFLIVPISGVLFGGRTGWKTKLVGLSPFIATTAFVGVGYFYDVWHPTWVIFFIIVILGLLFEKQESKKWGGIALFTVIPLVYVFLELNYDFTYSWLLFVVLLVAGYFMGYINIVQTSDPVLKRKLELSILAMGAVYAVLGFAFDLWHPGWLIFLLIPVLAMVLIKEKIPFVAYTPFIATFLFVLAGELFDAYAWSWLVFMIIPVAGIFTDGKKVSSFEMEVKTDTFNGKKPLVEVKIGGDDEEDI